MYYLTRWQSPDVATWRPAFGRLTNLSEELDRLFEAPLAELARTSQLLHGGIPALDVYEDKENVVVKAELPGIKREDISITLADGALTISGETRSESKHEGANVHRSERFFGRFERSVPLPTPVAPDQVKAQYRDGILTITLPKTEEAKPKQINVSIN